MNWADIQRTNEDYKDDSFDDDDQHSTILSEFRWISQFPKEKTIMVEITKAFSPDVWIILISSVLAMLLLFYVANELFLKIGFKQNETDYLDMLPFR